MSPADGEKTGNPGRRQRRKLAPRRSSRRRGAVVVETAVLAPFLVALILLTVDVGQYLIVAQTVSNASREAARFAARHMTASVTEVDNAAADYLANSFVDTEIQVNVRDEFGNAIPSGDLTAIPTGSPLTVEVVCPFNNVRWINIVPLPNNGQLATATTVRRE